MNHIRFIVLFTIITMIDGVRWYSATIENRSHQFPEQRDVFRTNYDQDAEHRYMPLSFLNRAVSDDWRGVTKSINSDEGIFPFDSLQTAKEDSLSMNIIPQLDNQSVPTAPTMDPNSNNKPDIAYNNTITNINLLKVPPNRRKVIRKRCPALRPRRKKQLRNEKTKTRFLEVFQVVEFDHVECTSSSGLEGTCLHEYDCVNTGGQPMGTCADSYGVCCVVQLSCDDNTAAPVGWFTNPGFPDTSSDRLSCTLTVNKISGDIKQIRLDFLNFELLPPTSGTCEQDQFVVSGQNDNSIVPILCGVNTGLHVYMEVDDVDKPITMSVQTATADRRLFAIKITQLTATDELAAPTGCLQYFKGSNGYLESFNYRDTSDTSIAKVPMYLNNLNYAMCIERASSCCSITYTNAGIMQIVNYDSDGLPVIPPSQAGVEIFNCPSDWLLVSAARLCGDRLNDGSVIQDFAINAPVTDTSAGPIVVWFRSDEGYVGRGFKLQYQQNSCSS